MRINKKPIENGIPFFIAIIDTPLPRQSKFLNTFHFSIDKRDNTQELKKYSEFVDGR